MNRLPLVRALLVVLAAAGAAAADDIEAEVAKLKYGDTVGFFGRGRANRHYEYVCSRCGGKGYWIPTGSHAEAADWVRLHCRQAHGMAGGAASGSGTTRLNDLAAEAMARGIVERDGEMFAMGASAALLGGLIDGLFSASGPSAADLAHARALREEEERRRLEEIARLEELARRERIVRAAGLREEWDRREAEMSRRLDGVFDVVRRRPDTPFFGEEALEETLPAESLPSEATAAPPVPAVVAIGGPAP
ncbi:MAG TPA: hypothetical protein VEJ18_01410, partial [Planctomycetota bacterium]|nr:hypothetical protein [Planctomycetota bacterium]